MPPPTVLLAVLVAAAAPALVLADECLCQDAARDPVCGSDGTTYPSRCALDCARTGAHAGPLLAHAGPCSVSATWNFVELGECTTACSQAFEKCVLPCEDHACLKGCLQQHAVGCYCDCRRYLNGTSTSSGDPQGFAPEGVLLPGLLAAPTISPDQEDAEDLGRCFSSNLTDLQDCTTKCKVSDSSCLASCYLASYDQICQCSVEPRGVTPAPAPPTSTTPAPTPTPTPAPIPAPTQSPRPSTEPPNTDLTVRDSEFYMCSEECYFQYNHCFESHCSSLHMDEDVYACDWRCKNVFIVDNKFASCMCRCAQFPLDSVDYSRTPRWLLLGAAANNNTSTTPFQTCFRDTQTTGMKCADACDTFRCTVGCIAVLAAGLCTCTSAAGGLAGPGVAVLLSTAAVLLSWARV